jgi:hypothetical protein
LVDNHEPIIKDEPKETSGERVDKIRLALPKK